MVVGVGPDMRPVRHKPVRLALGERRVGEQRRRQWLQQQRHAQLSPHISLGREIQVDLHGTGAGHHIEPHGADQRHIPLHDGVAPFRHPRHRRPRRDRMKPQWREPHFQPVARQPNLLEMGLDLLPASRATSPPDRPTAPVAPPVPARPTPPLASDRSRSPRRGSVRRRTGRDQPADRECCPAARPPADMVAASGRRVGNRTSHAPCRCGTGRGACSPPRGTQPSVGPT